MRGWCSTAGPRPRSPGRSSRSAWGSEWAPPGCRPVPGPRGRAPSYSPRVTSSSAPSPSATPRNDAARAVERTYLVITLLSTLASSFIWGINTIFLLDAGLSNAEAFAANAFFTLGMVIFEIPTGVVADTRGRQLSFVLGTLTLLLATLLYLFMWQGPGRSAGARCWSERWRVGWSRS